jgi:hypothetical protein
MRCARCAAIVVATLALHSPHTTLAAEAGQVAAVYSCHAVEITKSMVVACSDRYPVIGARADRAYATWLDHNAAGAKRAAAACQQDLRHATNSEDEYRAMAEQVKRLEQQMIMDMHHKIEQEGRPFCEKAIRDLQAGGMPIDRAILK